MQGLRQLKLENAKLRKLLAKRDLKIDVVKEISEKNGERVRTSHVASEARSYANAACRCGERAR